MSPRALLAGPDRAPALRKRDCFTHHVRDNAFTAIAVIVALGWLARTLAVIFFDKGVDQQRTDARLAALERQMRTLHEHLGIDSPSPDLSSVIEHLREGRKIVAIKEYRALTGVDLREAAGAVEQLARDHGL